MEDAEKGESEGQWERTNVTNLLRNRVSGTYYARVKVNGKQKWRTLKTTVFTVAKLRLADVEKELRAHGAAATGEARTAGVDEMTIGHFVDVYLARLQQNASLAPATRERNGTAIKAVLKTWPGLRERDVRRVTEGDCRAWAAAALREGTGFIAPNAKTRRWGMSASAYNKCVDALRAVLELAREHGVTYKNAAAAVEKAPAKRKKLDLPTRKQFDAIVQHVRTSGSKWSRDCADLVRLLAYSGVRLREGLALRWRNVEWEKNQLAVPGTKTAASDRRIPLFPSLKALLEELRQRRGDEPPDAPLVKVGHALGALDSACEAVGAKRLTHHDLRHLFATRCIEAGVDIPTVSRWLGHSDGGALAMRVYGHLRQEHSQTQAAKVLF